jgi:hypothetical protein
MSANEITTLLADAPERNMDAVMMELLLKWITTARIVLTNLDRNQNQNPTLIPNHLIIKKILAVVQENNMDAVKTAYQQGLVLKELFQCLAVQAAPNQPQHHHNLI